MLPDIKHRDDSFVAKLGCRASFALESLTGLVIDRQVWMHDFNADQAIKRRIMRSKDQTHATAGHEFNDTIVGNSTDLVIRFRRIEYSIKFGLTDGRTGNYRVDFLNQSRDFWIVRFQRFLVVDQLLYFPNQRVFRRLMVQIDNGAGIVQYRFDPLEFLITGIARQESAENFGL